MAALYEALLPAPEYWDRRTCSSFEDWKEAVAASTVVYVGNLNFSTTEEELYELASQTGSVQRIVMGLNRLTKAPCGFAFIEFLTSREAKLAVQILSGATCDARVIRVDADSGRAIDGDRKYGRGISGKQWRDEWRDFFDPGRGGAGGELGKRRRVASPEYSMQRPNEFNEEDSRPRKDRRYGEAQRFCRRDAPPPPPPTVQLHPARRRPPPPHGIPAPPPYY